MDYKNTGTTNYYASCTFEDFYSEWGEPDSSNIPFFYDGYGSIVIYQPRKESIYTIYIDDFKDHEDSMKEIVRNGLVIIGKDL